MKNSRGFEDKRIWQMSIEYICYSEENEHDGVRSHFYNILGPRSNNAYMEMHMYNH